MQPRCSGTKAIRIHRIRQSEDERFRCHDKGAGHRAFGRGARAPRTPRARESTHDVGSVPELHRPAIPAASTPPDRLLLLKFVKNPALATPEQVERAAWSTVPNVPLLFWSFRLMVGLGLFFILLFAAAFYLSARHRLQENRWFLKLACVSLPLPWIAAELGWIVAECGRQPWAVDGLLPTFLGVSAVPVSDVILSLAGFVIFYSALAVVDAFLMARMIRRGPAELGYWPERPSPVEAGAGAPDGDGAETLRPIVAG
jgi:cytochrome bd-type quinol oxidase subunit 1